MGIQLMAQLDSNLAKMAKKDLPFVTALALSKTAIGARDKVRAGLPKKFTLRNNWTRGGIQARTASKTNLIASVLAPDYMAIQETGGTRRPRSGRLLAAPSEASKSSSVIPKDRRPRAMLGDRAFLIDMGNGEAGVFSRNGQGRIRLLWWLSPQQEYEDRFEFQDDVESYVNESFSSHFLTEWSRVVGGRGPTNKGSKARR